MWPQFESGPGKSQRNYRSIKKKRPPHPSKRQQTDPKTVNYLSDHHTVMFKRLAEIIQSCVIITSPLNKPKRLQIWINNTSLAQ